MRLSLQLSRWTAALALVLLTLSCKPQEAQITWRRVLMDESRAGVQQLDINNLESTLGTFEGEVYISPNGTRFEDGATPKIAALLQEVQPDMARLKEVVGHSASELDNPRDEADLPLGNLIVDMIRKGGTEYFRTPMDMAILN